MYSTNSQRGFTLLEITVYMALTAILLAGAWVSVFALLGSMQHEELLLAQSSDTSFVHAKIGWVFEGASQVQVVGDAAQVTRAGLPGGDNPIVLSVDAGALYLKRGTGEQLMFASPGSVVQILDTDFFSYDPARHTVDVSFQLFGVVRHWTYYIP